MVEDMASRTRVFGALDTLENLKKGGRIGGAQALLGNLLSIKPLIDVSTGRVEEAGKARTRKKALQWLADRLLEEHAVERLCVAPRRGARPRRVPRSDRVALPARRDPHRSHRRRHRHARRTPRHGGDVATTARGDLNPAGSSRLRLPPP